MRRSALFSPNRISGSAPMTHRPPLNWSRREFIELSAAAAGVSLAPIKFRAVAPSDTVRFGMVGIGMQGSGLLGTSIQLPGVTCAAAADLYDGRHTLAKEIVGPTLATTREYRRLLDDKTIDCIVAAVPDHWHRRMVVEAVSAGKDIYIEKPMSHNAADGVAMVDAVKKSGRILQVGSQRVSSQICAKAKEMVAQGMLGDLTLVEGWLGRNEPPKQAAAVGGIRRWKDGRNMPDVHATIYYYGDTDLPVYMRLNLGTEMPEQYRIQGSKGVLEVSGNTLTFTPQDGKDRWPSYYTGSYPRALRDVYDTQWHKEHDLQAGQAPPLTETVSFSTPDFDDTRPHLWNFFEAVRTRKPVVEDVVFGHNAALACHMANEGYFRRTAVTWDEATKTIKG